MHLFQFGLCYRRDANNLLFLRALYPTVLFDHLKKNRRKMLWEASSSLLFLAQTINLLSLSLIFCSKQNKTFGWNAASSRESWGCFRERRLVLFAYSDPQWWLAISHPKPALWRSPAKISFKLESGLTAIRVTNTSIFLGLSGNTLDYRISDSRSEPICNFD